MATKSQTVKLKVPYHMKGPMAVFDANLENEDVIEQGTDYVVVINPSKELLATKGVSIIEK